MNEGFSVHFVLYGGSDRAFKNQKTNLFEIRRLSKKPRAAFGTEIKRGPASNLFANQGDSLEFLALRVMDHNYHSSDIAA